MNFEHCDMLGNELRVGAVVAVPQWDSRQMMLGVVKKLSSGYDVRVGHFHNIEVNFNGTLSEGAWRGSSILMLSEAEAVLARLRDLEPVEDEA